MSVEEHDATHELSWAPVLDVGAKLVVGLTLAGWIAWQGFMPAFFATVHATLPPIGRPHVGALFVPVCAYLWSAASSALALSRASLLRSVPWRTRVRVAVVCFGFGVLGGALVYVAGGSVLPLHSRAPQLRGELPPEQAVGMSPYLLTNSELRAVEAYIRGQGGQLRGPALMRQVRLLCACVPPLFGVLTAVAIVRAPARRALLHALVLQTLLFACLLGTSGGAMVVATFRRPRVAPLIEAWLLLATLTIGALWWAWRTWQREMPDGGRLGEPALPSVVR